MMRGTIRQTIGAAAMAALLPLLCVSCSSEDGISTASVGGGDGGTVTVGLTLRAYALESDGIYFEAGTDYENYIDIRGGDYRIYFFEATANDGDDVLITTFTPESLLPVDESNYTEYTMLGEAPDNLLTYSNFKVVILANWGTSNYPEVAEGTTKISDLCEDSNGKGIYSHLTDFELSSSKLIPFYGVNDYTGVTFKANDATILDEPITLLRAMAKVEVLFDTDDESYEEGTVFTDVRVIHYNDQGYCAPDKAYTRLAYDHYTESNIEDEWSADFADDIHLINGVNDNQGTAGTPIERSLDFQPADEDSIKWYAYLPEYDNTTYSNDYAYIEVKLRYRNHEEGPYRIYFANYDDDGTTDNSYDDGNRYDIARNNLYRFTVTLGEYFRVHTNKWIEEYVNDFVYDTTIEEQVGGDD